MAGLRVGVLFFSAVMQVQTWAQEVSGCGAPTDVNHSFECLRGVWKSVGCYATGNYAPDNVNVDWWREQTLTRLKADMALSKKFADQGSSTYRNGCYGNPSQDINPVSIKKPARQSSSYPNGQYRAQLAADANNNCFTQKGTLLPANQSRTTSMVGPWWAVDLQGYYKIDAVLVIAAFLDGDNVGRYRVVGGTHIGDITNGFTLCAESYEPNVIIRCNTETIVTNIGILGISQDSYGMSLCKVVVYGTPACPTRGQYGSFCDQSCVGLCRNDNCDARSGTCYDGCQGQQAGQKCEDCLAGFYSSNCSLRCSEGCTGGACNKSDGDCICKTGYYGQGGQCQTCEAGCSGPCDIQDGSCSCLPGLSGKKCDTKCTSGKWGAGCERQCSPFCVDPMSCDPRNGGCSCKPGYTGDICEQRCPEGTWGPGCSNKCAPSCSGGKTCDHVNGVCMCQMGYTGDTCLKKCPTGSFGSRCSGRCHCSGGPPDCSHVNGSCSSGMCEDGWRGLACQTPTDAQGPGSGIIGPAVGGAFAAILIILIVAAVILVVRRRNTRNKNAKPVSVELGSSESDDVSNTLVKTSDQNGNNSPISSVEEKSIKTETVEETEPKTKRTSENSVSESSPTGVSTVADEEPMYENIGEAVSKFPEYFHRMRQTDKAFEQEYESLPSGLNAPCTAGRRPKAVKKNRFRNIVPYDHSRVILLEKNENSDSEYINANYIQGYTKGKRFIAAQGPTKSSVEDFIRMLWEQKVSLVVMVTNLKENGKDKCEKYWPNTTTNPPVDADGIRVSLKSEERMPHFTIRKLLLGKDGQAREINHIQYTTWPDHGVPASPAAFLDFHKRARSMYGDDDGPPVVHCSAGVGRTGTFIAIDYLLSQAEAEGRVSVLNCVTKMRADRVNMVQSPDQYVFIHEALLEALHCGQTVYPAVEFEAKWSDIKRDLIKQQFEMLEKLKPSVKPDEYRDAKIQENIGKNYSQEILPLNKWRPYLTTPVRECNDYINAVFVNGYQKKNAFVITQYPLPDTLVDFWRLVYEYRCTTIVSLDDHEKPPYWSDTEDTVGPFTVQSTEGKVSRNMELFYQKEIIKMKHFNISMSNSSTKLPEKDLSLETYRAINRWQQESGDGVILIHCRNGCELSGLFLSLHHICEKIDSEQEVDVFHAVKKVRESRPEFIPTVEQYMWLHEAAFAYINLFSTYSNFR